MAKFGKYHYTDPLRFVGGKYINLEQLTEKQFEALVKKEPGIVTVIETVPESTPESKTATKKK